MAGGAEKLDGVATSAVEEPEEEDDPVMGPFVISSRTRSSRTYSKEGKGRCLVIHVRRWP